MQEAEVQALPSAYIADTFFWSHIIMERNEILNLLAFNFLGIICLLGIIFSVKSIVKASRHMEVRKRVFSIVVGIVCFPFAFWMISFIIEQFLIYSHFYVNASFVVRMYFIFISVSCVLFAISKFFTYFLRKYITHSIVFASALITNMLMTLHPIVYAWVTFVFSLK